VPLWTEQAGKGKALRWVEQAGKGGKRKIGRLTLATPSAPPLIHFEPLVDLNGNSAGHARDHICEASEFPLPLPSLFNPQRRPSFPA